MILVGRLMALGLGGVAAAVSGSQFERSWRRLVLSPGPVLNASVGGFTAQEAVIRSWLSLLVQLRVAAVGLQLRSGRVHA